MKAWNYLQKASGLLLNTEIIKQTHKIMMEDENDIMVEEDRKSPVFLDYHILHQLAMLKDTCRGQFLGFMKLKK